MTTTVTKKITRARLKQLVTYDSTTGLMAWKTPRGRVKIGTVISCKDSRGYLVVRLDGVLHRVHRLAWLYVHGKLPTMIDHINRDTSDNRICNLRECTQRQNMLNTNISSKNKSGFKGVSFDKRKNMFRATTSINKKHIFLGYFKSAKDASTRYLEYQEEINEEGNI